jgi:hypothetical protein
LPMAVFKNPPVKKRSSGKVRSFVLVLACGTSLVCVQARTVALGARLTLHHAITLVEVDQPQPEPHDLLCH